MKNPAPTVLADLLVVSSEAGAERLVAVDRAAREAFGSDVVTAGHREWTGRLRAAFPAPVRTGDGQIRPARPDAAAAGPGRGHPPARMAPEGYTDTPPNAPAERSGSPAGPSEAALHLVRRLPDPSRGGQAGQAAR